MSNTKKRHIVIGTAGHIDHGKSALIKALTGVDPDRLKEEKERGMTTDLGFVFYGDNATLIDVPGHEKFVRHMVAGASTIDIVLLVIAADDGIMPQTREHLEILKLLGIKKGVVVITKKDLVSTERLQIVIEEIKNLVKDSFLKKAPVIAVSNVTKEGINELKSLLDRLIAETESKIDQGIFRMPIDRCFTIKGFGTVVAGTVLSGKIKVGDEVEVLPQKRKVKIRRIEVHNKPVDEVSTGFRAAINLIGVEKDEINRGDVLSQIGFFHPSLFLNASLYLLPNAERPLKNFERVRIHLGTKEVLGRVVILGKKEISAKLPLSEKTNTQGTDMTKRILLPKEKALVQFRLEEPVVTNINDRYVIRTYSPQTTIGGGIILDPKATKVKGYDEELLTHLARTESGEPIDLVEEDLLCNFQIAKKPTEIAQDINLPVNEVIELLKQLVQQKKVLCLDENRALNYHSQNLFYHSQNAEKLQQQIIEKIKEYHQQNPTSIGITPLALLKTVSVGLDKILLDWAIDQLQTQGKIQVSSEQKIRLSDFKMVVEKNIAEYVEKIEKLLLSCGYEPLTFSEIKSKISGKETEIKQSYQYLLDQKILINIGEGLVLHQKYIKQAEIILVDFLKKNGSIRVSQFRDLLKASRRTALPLLIFFDNKGITIRKDDIRVLSKKFKD
ncbi:MAG: selenocysteine-specific translation elongation factor [candidate division WOR-3 bacterium]|nr:selenocysteine-specific translation elongation factor [candidate division WOR-3 bacterium]